jgi:succinate dehydrogenase / fumarate reductase iron-sulfur subunit
MSGANASPTGRSDQEMSGANASPTGRSDQEMSGANASRTGRSHQEITSVTFQVWRGDRGEGQFVKYTTEISEGMVVLDAIHKIQAEQANDLAVRWNCKAGKCGSCSAEINGMPRLMCMTRMNELPTDRPVLVEPMKSFPHIRDLVTDVSWNFEVKKKIKEFKPRPPDNPDGSWRIFQEDVDRVQEFRKCIECFLCQDVCHVLRDHRLHKQFIGPRFFVHVAALEMHPLDVENRIEELKKSEGIGYCNITKCCTAVCPESIKITDNAIIPLKERVVDEFYDPIRRLFRMFKSGERSERKPDRAQPSKKEG